MALRIHGLRSIPRNLLKKVGKRRLTYAGLFLKKIAPIGKKYQRYSVRSMRVGQRLTIYNCA